MNALKWGLALVVVALLGVAAGYRWAVRSGHETSVVLPSSADQSARRILYYQDPMKPGIKFDKPGKSPFMDMDLMPVYADDIGADSANGDGVTLTAGIRQNLGIRLGRVEKRTVAPRITAVGSVAYDERDIALVQMRVPGYVTRLPVRATLERVRRGQALAQITAPAWIEAAGEYLAVLGTESAGASAMREAARQRLLLLGLPELDVVEMERSRTVPASITLRSPINGVVTELGVREGAAFESGTVLFRLNGTSTVWVNAQLPQSQGNAIESGAVVATSSAAAPGQVFSGRVQTMLPQVDDTTRTLSVRIVVDNRAGLLSPGMFVQSDFVGSGGKPALWVPSEAVITTGQRGVVIVAGANGFFEAVDVVTGMEVDGQTAIVSGLTEGQAIVLSGQFLIDSEASLRAALARLSTASETTAGSTP